MKPVLNVICKDPLYISVTKNGRPVSLAVALAKAKEVYPDKEFEQAARPRAKKNARAVHGRLVEVQITRRTGSDVPYCVACGRKSESHGAGWCRGYTVYATFSCYRVLFADGTALIVEAPTIQFASAWLSGEDYNGLSGLKHDHGRIIELLLVQTKEWSKDLAFGGDNVLNVTNFRQRPTGLKCVGDDS